MGISIADERVIERRRGLYTRRLLVTVHPPVPPRITSIFGLLVMDVLLTVFFPAPSKAITVTSFAPQTRTVIV
jgi:hypothetical protein